MIQTLLQIVVYNNPDANKGIELGDIISNLIQVIALGFALYSFSKTNKTTALFQKAETRKNWFLTVIVQPHIGTITSFYEKTFVYLANGVNQLKLYSNSPSFTTDGLNDLKVENNSKFQEEKVNLSLSFIEIIKSYNPSMVAQLSSCLNDLEDIYVNAIDASTLSSLDLEAIELDIHRNKSKFFSLLFQEVDKKQGD